jgi:hypothetical protein
MHTDRLYVFHLSISLCASKFHIKKIIDKYDILRSIDNTHQEKSKTSLKSSIENM